jgi:hypothetical protein
MPRKRRSDFSVLEIAQGKMPRLEKQVEHAGDRFMVGQMGFKSIHFSQPRATMQTPGISDRRYYNTTRRVSAWWEAKGEDGRQTKAEWEFQQIVEACGEVYLLGTEEVLAAWCHMRCPSQEQIENSRRWVAEGRPGILFDVDALQPERFRYREPKPRRKSA